jgi:urease accessory protein
MPGAAALLTTPAATKLYRTNGLRAELIQEFVVEADASLEWLPQEIIVFDGAVASSTTQVTLLGTARFVGWEIMCLGRPAANEQFEQGHFAQSLEIQRDGEPLWLERCHFDGGDEMLAAPWGLGGRTVLGSFVCSGVKGTIASEIVESVVARHGFFSVSQIRDLVVCRYLGNKAQEARELFADAWRMLRPRSVERVAVAPRIWAT